MGLLSIAQFEAPSLRHAVLTRPLHAILELFWEKDGEIARSAILVNSKRA